MQPIRSEPHGPSDRVPILFVHGAWHGAWCWEPHFLPFFESAGHPAYAIDLRGHGSHPAPRPLRRVTLGDYVEDVARAAAAIHPAPVLVGHSMGGLIVSRCVQAHDAPGAVLLAAVPPRGALGITARFVARHPLAFARVIAWLRLEPVVDSPERARELLVSDRLSAEEWTPYQARLRDESFTAYLQMLAALVSRPAPVRAPMLVLGAGGDRMVTAGEVRATAEAFGAEMEIIPALSHAVMLDPEWRIAAERILAWIGALRP